METYLDNLNFLAKILQASTLHCSEWFTNGKLLTVESNAVVDRLILIVVSRSDDGWPLDRQQLISYLEGVCFSSADARVIPSKLKSIITVCEAIDIEQPFACHELIIRHI